MCKKTNWMPCVDAYHAGYDLESPEYGGISGSSYRRLTGTLAFVFVVSPRPGSGTSSGQLMFVSLNMGCLVYTPASSSATRTPFPASVGCVAPTRAYAPATFSTSREANSRGSYWRSLCTLFTCGRASSALGPTPSGTSTVSARANVRTTKCKS